MATFELSLDIPDIKIEKMEPTENKDGIITVLSTVVGTCCHRCGIEVSKPYCHGK
ncbi:MAG: hypothetical protein U9N43_02625 [Euryarchaeota archaeon]|nr:hypothetical protein [Euryarchaeota archaeon]